MNVIRFILVSALVAISCCVALSAAIDLIEMSDKNEAALLLPLARPLKGVQIAYRNEFNFKSIKAVEEFLLDCARVNDVIRKSSDDDYEGLAKQIKLIMAEPTIATACSARFKDIKKAGLDKFDEDFTLNDLTYLSVHKTEKLVKIKKAVEQSTSLSAAVGKLLNNTISDLAEESLEDAAKTINIYFDDREKKGYFDFGENYRSTCKIQRIQPICKLVRRSSDKVVSAISEDLADFVEIVQAKDEAKLAKHQQLSGVTLHDVKTQCAGMRFKSGGSFLGPIGKIHKWIAEGLMSKERFQERLTVDRELAFYDELNKLCKLVQ